MTAGAGGRAVATPFPHGADLAAARALDGDKTALQELLVDPTLLDAPRFVTAIPALALEAKRLAIEIPGPWHRRLLHSACTGLFLKSQLEGVGRVLDSAGIPWMPIKGMDLGYRLWAGPEARPTSDLDVLVPIARLAEARAVLTSVGWTGLEQGDADEDYLTAEGYNWHARNSTGALLELHYRFWGSTPAKWPESVWEQSLEAPELGTRARRPSWPDAFLICAVHLWQLPPPHSVLYFRELELIARRCGAPVLEQVESSARRGGLSLQVCLAALYTAHLWKNQAMRTLATALQADLQLPERVLLRAAVARGIDAAGIGQLYVARLLSGRETRLGWKAGFRRLWPHPAVRARRVPDDAGRVRKNG